jgi:tetratricopeptide (TPR) repeat protein
MWCHWIIGAIAVLALAGCNRAPKIDTQLSTPKLAFEALGHPSSFYFTDDARPHLARDYPNLLHTEDRDRRSQRTIEFGRAAKNPTLWRQLDRKWRFEAALLTGDPASYRELCAHLRASSDWVLSYLDHTSIIFRRAPAPPWKPESLKNLSERFAYYGAAERVTFLVGLAGRLMAVNQDDEAKRQLELALTLDDKSPAVLSQWAVYHMNRGAAQEALVCAEKATEADRDFASAWSVKAQAYMRLRNAPKAFEASSQLVRVNPKDPSTLLLHARIAHENHAYHTEIDALKLLIKDARHAGYPLAGYRTYLAQAYASSGAAREAVEEFQNVLKEPEASPEQRQFAQESIQRIRSRAQL